ncbi:MAG: YggS family pyridoxal phosphate-dependent enzyme [Lachnospiraceae bacterium]|nr:YggS family pyridoxal phosphate-dependent enzyme [Lachnospiraceae bacterium]
MVSENLKQIRDRIAAACERTGRNPGDVRLIAVSKTKPSEMIREAYAAGQTEFGENKVQEMCQKAEELSELSITWHLIGHLQKNKVRKAVAVAAMIHSVDSVELAAEIQKEAARINKVQDILLEVNVAAEESKFGFRPEEVADAAEQIFRMPNVRLCGLMTVAPYTENPSENRVYFGQLRKLAVDILSKNKDNVSEYCISMGMSNDFEEAVEEGATMVRVGSLIFGERHYEDKTEGSK